VAQAAGDIDQAIQHYQAAVRSDPELTSAHYNLGLLLQGMGRLPEATTHYQETLALAPDNADAHNNLGNILASQGNLAEAMRHYEATLALDPGHALAHNNLGNALRSVGRIREAQEQFREALRADPEYPTAHYNLGLTLQFEGNSSEAVGEFREAARLRPNWAPPLAAAGWILATHPDRSVRRPGEAVRLATDAARLTEGRDPGVLDVLAAAYASAGQFDRAVEAATVAVQQAAQLGMSQQAIMMRQRLELYRRGQPYVEALPSRAEDPTGD
jgi:tetratricopeptide (TPR) repeat protein